MAATATHHDDHPPAALPDATVNVRPVTLASVVALIVGALVYLIGGFVGVSQDQQHGVRDFFMTYLCGFVFWCCVPFGSLILSMIGYLAQASWSIVFRRVFQASIRTLPLMFVLGLPIVGAVLWGGNNSPFWWTDPVYYKPPTEVEKGLNEEQAKEKEKYMRQELGVDFEKDGVKEKDAKRYEEAEKVTTVAAAQHVPPLAAEENLHKIKDWLSPGKFLVRYLIYFVVIGAFAFFLHRQARRVEDQVDTEKEKYKLHVISGPGIPIVVLTLTAFITDWVMSVEPSWASSMFPVVFMFNTVLTTLTLATLVFYTLTKVPNDTAPRGNRPDLTAIIKDKFRIDIGSLTLGFCMAWAYASFCQFMLIWAGNLPEEIPYYLKRGAGNADALANGMGVVHDKATGAVIGEATGWIYLTYVLMAFHWLLPFVVLLFREVKTSPRGMKAMACLLLTVCACDVIWWILPSVPHEKTYTHLPMAFGAVLLVGGIWGLVFAWQLGKRAILGKDSDVRFLANWGHH